MKTPNSIYRLIFAAGSHLTRRIFTTMSTSSDCRYLQPPIRVKGMTKLNRDLFEVTVNVPCLTVKLPKIRLVVRYLHSCILMLKKFQSVRENLQTSDAKDILLNPTTIRKWEDLETAVAPEIFSTLDVNEADFSWKAVDLTYDNWKHEEIFRSVLPDGLACSGFSQIGHIIHLNLNDTLLPYRSLIGEVLLDKLPNMSLVVNKVAGIDNTYRNFNMEILAGQGGTITTVNENGCALQLDFANVYWNSRLGTEHERIVKSFQKHDYVFDVFAGVGPFAVPAGKKKCKVFANDLNPEAFHWLKQNVEKNKTVNYVQAYNMDGKDFILEVMRSNLPKIWGEMAELKAELSSVSPNVHVVMNLPAMAVEFVTHFKGLLHAFSRHEHFVAPVVYCYCFVKEKTDGEEMLLRKLSDSLDKEMKKDDVTFFNVRNVAPNKEMLRMTFKLDADILYGKQPCKRFMTSDDTSVKKLCVENA